MSVEKLAVKKKEDASKLSFGEEFVQELERLHVTWLVKKKHRSKLQGMSAEKLQQTLSMPYALRQETKGMPASELAHFFLAYQLKLYRRLFFLSLPLVSLLIFGFKT